MSKEVKTVSGLKIALVVVSTLFVISLIANVYLYTRQYGGITPDSGLENQIANLQSEYDDYVANHHHTDSAYDALESERDSLKASKLIMVNLYGTDNRPWLQTPYLEITGEVVNVGTYTAYSCKLHVILYQGEVVAEDTYINLGTIVGEGSATVDSKIYYTGEALTHWSKTTEWD